MPLKKLLLVLLLSLERLLDEQKLVMRRFLASIKKGRFKPKGLWSYTGGDWQSSWECLLEVSATKKKKIKF